MRIFSVMACTTALYRANLLRRKQDARNTQKVDYLEEDVHLWNEITKSSLILIPYPTTFFDLQSIEEDAGSWL